MNTATTALLSAAFMLASLHSVQSARVQVAQTTGTPGSSIATGSKEKTQIPLGGSGSIMRAGSKTEAVLQNETDLALRQGVMLASSGKRTLGREPVSVETPETKSTVKGTM